MQPTDLRPVLHAQNPLPRLVMSQVRSEGSTFRRRHGVSLQVAATDKRARTILAEPDGRAAPGRQRPFRHRPADPAPFTPTTYTRVVALDADRRRDLPVDADGQPVHAFEVREQLPLIPAARPTAVPSGTAGPAGRPATRHDGAFSTACRSAGRWSRAPSNTQFASEPRTRAARPAPSAAGRTQQDTSARPSARSSARRPICPPRRPPNRRRSRVPATPPTVAHVFASAAS